MRNALLGFGLASAVTTAAAGPLVNHPLVSEVPGQGGEVVPGPLQPPTATVEATASSPRTLDAFGDSGGLPTAARLNDAVVSDRVRDALPTHRTPASDIDWLVAAKTDRRLRAAQVAERPRKMVSEPASIVLLITGLVGIFARRQLLKQRASK